METLLGNTCTGHGWYSIGFDSSLRASYRHVTDRSHRHQQGDVGSCFFQAFCLCGTDTSFDTQGWIPRVGYPGLDTQLERCADERIRFASEVATDAPVSQWLQVTER